MKIEIEDATWGDKLIVKIKCEYCGNIEEIQDDDSIHIKAIQHFYCEKCGKNSAGELQDKQD